jgi:hypothetical protein
METLLDPNDPEAQACPEYKRQRAIAKGRRILKIIWDKQDGYPEHAWGFVQWSIRPYEQRDGCDGTTAPNIHLIALRLCEALGLDYPALYEQAYQDHEQPGRSWLRFFDWSYIEEETIIPKLSEQALRNLLHDLGKINNGSIVAILEHEFTRLGYNVAKWWED